MVQATDVSEYPTFTLRVLILSTGLIWQVLIQFQGQLKHWESKIKKKSTQPKFVSGRNKKKKEWNQKMKKFVRRKKNNLKFPKQF